ncbi:transposable element Tcb2 transposase [Trichonephila clavipes]|nr:transposable element Tcb2 transposase [Trichonephila clavipes]
MRIQISGTKRRRGREKISPRRLIRKLEEGCSLTSVAEKFGINKCVVSRAWRAFQTIGTAVRKVGGGHPRKTTAMDDVYIVL